MLNKLFPNLIEFIDAKVEAVAVEQKGREAIGAITDREKLIILKQQLYRDARSGKDTTNLRSTIYCIQDGLNAESREINSFNAQLTGFSHSLLLIAVLATGLSYAIAANCGSHSSQLCRDARVIPDAIARYIQ